MTILDQPASTSAPMEYAGFGERLLARIIDGFILLIPSVILPLIAPWLYFAIQEGSKEGATIGKRAMGIRVVSENGEAIGFGTATGRFFGVILTFFTCFLGFLLMLFNSKSQCLHDLITGTVVIKADANTYDYTSLNSNTSSSRPVKRSWMAKLSDTETHYVEIDAQGGRHWRRTPTGEQVHDFTLWQLTDGLVDYTPEFGVDTFQEMKNYAEQLLRSRA